jgi:antitoxin HicB
MPGRKPIASVELTYTVVFTPDAEAGGYVVTCPALPGLVTEGETLEDAKRMARDAIAVYLEGLRELGRPIPPGEERSEESVREPVTVTLPAA